MTKAEKLEALIQKAIDGGWAHEDYPKTPKDILDWYEGNANDFIWRHDFAKALWGEEIAQDLKAITDYTSRDQWIKSLVPVWQYHLQQMVIADDPVEHAYKSIFS